MRESGNEIGGLQVPPPFGVDNQGLSPRYLSQFSEKDIERHRVKEGLPFLHLWHSPLSRWKGSGPLDFFLLFNQLLPFLLCFSKPALTPSPASGQLLDQDSRQGV